MSYSAWRSGSVATNVLLPWFMLIIFVVGLTAFRFYQTHENEALEEHSNLHRNAVRLASDLRYLAQQRWSNALAYQATMDTLNITQLQRSEIETQSKLDELAHLFPTNDDHYDAMIANQASALLESYRVIREGHPELYRNFIAAVNAGNRDHQLKLISLLSDKIRLVRASVDDLAAYHLIVVPERWRRYRMPSVGSRLRRNEHAWPTTAGRPGFHRRLWLH